MLDHAAKVAGPAYPQPWRVYVLRAVKYGDIITWNGYRATVIDPKTTDMVIKRHLIGLIHKQPLINPANCGKVD